MIIGIGTDIVEVSRIRRLLDEQGDRFKNRVFTEAERQKADNSSFPAQTYAKRFAAKEAFVKAIQTNGDGISWLEIEVMNHPSGAPELKLSGKALEVLHKINPKAIVFLSLADTKDIAQATVLISTRERE